MNIINKFKNALAAFNKTNNGVDYNAFLKYGSKKMFPTWSNTEISDKDFYTGYGFAVINKRANRSVVLGKNFLYTNAKDEVIAKANSSETRVVHPYLDLIKESTDFSERDFWYNISTYLDLEGVYYLMAVRTVTKNYVGKIQKFVLLNPYEVRQVVDSKGQIGGYIESGDHGYREIPKEMIIPIKLLNPTEPSKPYSLADAARDSQFTMKQANNFSREAIDGNLNSPGILSSAIELPDDQFDNFVERVKNHGKGEPLFGNGAGTISWTSMQTDLEKAALDKINSINRDVLLAISGLSKTGVGVEESGTGREVSRTQKDDFTENAVMPQIENIIDALNLDYRRYYSDEYKKFKYNIALDNPLETDKEAEQADVDIRGSQFTLMQSLVNAGYPYSIAAKYAQGLLDITDIGNVSVDAIDKKPTGDGTKTDTPVNDPAAKDPINPNSYVGKHFNVYEGYPIPVLQYLGNEAEQINSLSEEASFIYSSTKLLELADGIKTVRIQSISEMNNSLIALVDDNTFIKIGEFNQNADRVAIIAKLNKRYKNQLVAIKKKIDLDKHNHNDDLYEVIKNAVFDKQVAIDSSTNDLLSSVNAAEQKLYEWYVDQISNGVLSPHPTNLDEFINSMTLPFAVYFTVMYPIYASYRVRQTASELGITDQLPVVALTEEIRQTINNFAKRESVSHMNTIMSDIENALAIIRSKTSNPQEIKSMLQEAFKAIQSRRADVIASNAAARIFNISQYEADLQFLTRANMVDKAYKVMFSLTGSPCSICEYIIKQTNANPIPFTSAFVNMGEEIESGGKKMIFDYENIIAGNVHNRCHCAYKLVIKNDVA